MSFSPNLTVRISEKIKPVMLSLMFFDESLNGTLSGVSPVEFYELD